MADKGKRKPKQGKNRGRKKEIELLAAENKKHEARALRRVVHDTDKKREHTRKRIAYKESKDDENDKSYGEEEGVTALKGITLEFKNWKNPLVQSKADKNLRSACGLASVPTRRVAKRKKFVTAQNEVKLLTDMASHQTPLKHTEYRGFNRLFDEEPKRIPKARVLAYSKFEQQTAAKIEQILSDVDSSLLHEICDFVTRTTDFLPSGDSVAKNGVSFPVTKSLDDTSFDLNDQDLDAILSEFTRPSYYEIPTALLFVGVNVPDHHRLFCQLKATLQESRFAHRVASLEASECTTLTKTLKHIVSQLTGQATGLEQPMAALQKWYKAKGWRESKQETVKVPTDIYELSLPVDDLDSMSYSEKFTDSNNLFNEDNFSEDTLDGTDSEFLMRNDGSQGREHPSLVIILEDFESFKADLLQSLVSLISRYQSELPFVLVLGLATSADALHRLLTRAVSVRLMTEKFNFHAAAHSLDLIVNQVVIGGESGVCLGKKPFEFMVDNFYNWNLSIQTFSRALRFVVGEHFWGNPISYLCNVECTGPKNTIEAAHLKEVMCPVHIDYIKNELESVRKYLQTPAGEAIQSSLADDDFLYGQIAKWLNDIKRFQKNLPTFFACCFDFLSRFKPSGSTMTQQSAYKLVISAAPNVKRELANLTLPHHSALLHSKPFIAAITQLREANLVAIADMFKNWIRIIETAEDIQPLPVNKKSATEAVKESEEGSRDPVTQDMLRTMKDFISRLMRSAESASVPASSDSAMSRGNAQCMSPLRTSSGGMGVPPAGFGSPRRGVPNSPALWSSPSRPIPLVRGSSFDRLMIYNGLVDSFSDSIVKQLIGDIQQWIIDVFGAHLPSYDTFPMNEVFYYNTAAPLKQVFNAEMLTNVKIALSKPHRFLNWEGEEEIPIHERPDVCIVYELWAEAPNVINLRDMFDCFSSILDPDASNDTEQSAALLARFYDAVNEMQMMGFISQPRSRRNKDVVDKLTVGGKL